MYHYHIIMIQALNHALITEKYCLRSKMRPSSRLSQISSTPKRPLTQAEENAKQSTALRHTNISRAQTPLNNGPVVVAVRPDGMIGAFITSKAGAEKYIFSVFSH